MSVAPNSVASAFLDASKQAEHRVKLIAQRERIRKHRLLAVIAAVVVLVAVTAVVAVVARTDAGRQRDKVSHEHDVAASQHAMVDAAALTETNPALSLQLMRAAYDLDPAKNTRDSLVKAAAEPYAFTIPLPEMAYWLAVSPNGRAFAVAMSIGIELWDYTDPLRPARAILLADSFGSSAFSPDGALLAVWDEGRLTMWDVRNLRAPAMISTRTESVGDDYSHIAFSPDGRLVAHMARGSVSLWDVSDPAAPVLASHLYHEIPDFTDSMSGEESVAFVPGPRPTWSTCVPATGALTSGMCVILTTRTGSPRCRIRVLRPTSWSLPAQAAWSGSPVTARSRCGTSPSARLHSVSARSRPGPAVGATTRSATTAAPSWR
jgi:hypothetical protein